MCPDPPPPISLLILLDEKSGPSAYQLHNILAYLNMIKSFSTLFFILISQQDQQQRCEAGLCLQFRALLKLVIPSNFYKQINITIFFNWPALLMK